MQVEWFGKSGIAWHGAMFIRQYVPADTGEVIEVNPDEYVISYYDDITDDKKEYGCVVLSSMQADLRAFGADNLDVRAVDLKTDGAGCYRGKCTALALPSLTDWTGIRVSTHSLGEAGQNKSELHGHFGVAGPEVAAEVASGRGDTTRLWQLR
jgi:hypothetical protein